MPLNGAGSRAAKHPLPGAHLEGAAMTYDDDSEWRRDDRPSWRREGPRPLDAPRPARPPAAAAAASRPSARADANRPYEPRPPAVPTHDDAAVGDIAAMVERIIAQLDAADRTRRPEAAAPPPRAAERRPAHPAARPVAAATRPEHERVTGEPSEEGRRPFTEALRQHLREKARSEPWEAEPPSPDRARSSAERPVPPLPSDIDRHFRSLADRVDALRQQTDDRIGAVRDDVARLAEAVLARPVASLAPADRAALDALAARLDRAADLAPETLGRLDALQADMTALGRTVTDLDLDRRLYAVETGQDAVLERLREQRLGADPAFDALRRRIDWIAERLEASPAAEALATLDARLARLGADVRRIAEAPGRAAADEGLVRELAAMRGELADLGRGAIVSQVDELGSALARLAGEVKTAARSAGAETLPLVADLARRIEKLDRRLDDLAHPGRDDRLAGIERAIATLDRRLLAESRLAAEGRLPAEGRRVAESPGVATLRPAPADDRAPAVEIAAAPPPAAAVPPPASPGPAAEAERGPPTRTTRLIAAARRAVEHPILRRGGTAPVEGDAAAPAAGSRPTAPAAAAEPETAPPAQVVTLAAHRPAVPETDIFAAPAPFPAPEGEPMAAAGGLGARRLLLLAAAVIGLVGGAYGFASEPLRALISSLSGSETTSVAAGAVPTLFDPHTTGSIARAPAGNAAAAFSAARSVPGAATLPTTLGSPGLREAAAGGDPRAALEVAVALLDGVGVTRDPAAAVPWLNLAADAGLAPAEFRLGTLYERGIGVARSRDTAKAWYDRAAGRGHVKAMHNLAVLLAEAGEGRDIARAVGWFEKAARHGLVDSQFNLAVLYVRGLGVAADPAAAYRWFALAARQGDQEAAVRRDEVGRDLSPADRSAADLAIASWTAVPADSLANDGPPLPQQWTGVATSATPG
jgi:localization factor PodJL